MLSQGIEEENSMAWKQKFQQIVERLVQGGALFSSSACVAIALVEAATTLPVETLIPFLSGIGGNLIASILDRAAQGQQISEDELLRLLDTPSELEAVRQLLERHGTLLQDLLDELLTAAREIHAFRAESQSTHGQMLRDLAEILHHVKPPAMPTIEERQRILQTYAHQVLKSAHYQRITAGGVTAEASRFEDSIREPLLEDVFVEPYLIGAASLRQSREEYARLFTLTQDDEAESLVRNQARHRLLTLQNETWEQVSKSDSSVPAMKALEEEHVAVILGDPGSGKSTLLRWLLRKGAETLAQGEECPIPLFVAIGDYAQGGRDLHAGFMPLETWLRHRAESEHTGLGELVTHALSREGSGILLLLDGLDEVPQQLRRTIVPYIQDFISAHTATGKPTRVVITSRFFGYETAPVTAPAVQFVLAPFTDWQIEYFAEKWYSWLEQHLHGEQESNQAARVNAERFVRAVSAKPQIIALARNPLLLTMIAVVLRQGKRLPERRVELYDLALRQLMTQWEFQRRTARNETSAEFDVDYGEACEIWAPIARWMHEVGTGAVYEEDLKQRLAKRLKEMEREEKAKDWLSVRGDKCCLLQERGERLFGFLHQTFQEYLAAMDIWNGQFIEELDRYIEDPRWHEVLHLACGFFGVIRRPRQKDVVTALLRRILEYGSPYEALLHKDLFLAVSCMTDDVRPGKEVEKTIIRALLKVAASNEIESQRLKALELLIANKRVGLDNVQLEDLEPELTQDQNPHIRSLYMQWLASQPGSAPDAILTQIGKGKDYGDRAIAFSLCWQRHPSLASFKQAIEAHHQAFEPQREHVLTEGEDFTINENWAHIVERILDQSPSLLLEAVEKPESGNRSLSDGAQGVIFLSTHTEEGDTDEHHAILSNGFDGGAMDRVTAVASPWQMARGRSGATAV
jgi:hypothetical protein